MVPGRLPWIATTAMRVENRPGGFCSRGHEGKDQGLATGSCSSRGGDAYAQPKPACLLWAGMGLVCSGLTAHSAGSARVTCEQSPKAREGKGND
jgi:hypothetical protein